MDGKTAFWILGFCLSTHFLGHGIAWDGVWLENSRSIGLQSSLSVLLESSVANILGLGPYLFTSLGWRFGWKMVGLQSSLSVSNSVANILDLPWIPVSIHWVGVWLESSGQSVSIPYLPSGSVASRLGLSLIPYLPTGECRERTWKALGSSLASLSALMSSVANILGFGWSSLLICSLERCSEYTQIALLGWSFRIKGFACFLICSFEQCSKYLKHIYRRIDEINKLKISKSLSHIAMLCFLA
jgi:hypothetical protein